MARPATCLVAAAAAECARRADPVFSNHDQRGTFLKSAPYTHALRSHTAPDHWDQLEQGSSKQKAGGPMKGAIHGHALRCRSSRRRFHGPPHRRSPTTINSRSKSSIRCWPHRALSRRPSDQRPDGFDISARRRRRRRAGARRPATPSSRAMRSRRRSTPRRWDPSVKALVQFPDVLKNMSDKLDWTQKLGDAFLAQQDEVMDQIQFLRRQGRRGRQPQEQQKAEGHQRHRRGRWRARLCHRAADPDVVYVPVLPARRVYGAVVVPRLSALLLALSRRQLTSTASGGARPSPSPAASGAGTTSTGTATTSISTSTSGTTSTATATRSRTTSGSIVRIIAGRCPIENKDARDKFATGATRSGTKDDSAAETWIAPRSNNA